MRDASARSAHSAKLTSPAARLPKIKRVDGETKVAQIADLFACNVHSFYFRASRQYNQLPASPPHCRQIVLMSAVVGGGECPRNE